VNIGGKTRNFTEPVTLDISVASGTLNRYSSVFVRRDDIQRDIYLTVLDGGLSASPAPPVVTRDNGVYDLKLADIYIAAGTISVTQANITDTRMVKAVCGWVTATVTEIDYTQILAQFNAFLAEYRPVVQAEYNALLAFFTGLSDNGQTQYDGFVSALAALQAQAQQNTAIAYDDYLAFVNQYKQFIVTQYNAYLDFLSGYKTGSTTAYNALLAWFDAFKVDGQAELDEFMDTIRGILGEEEAGNLLNLIQQLQARQPTAQLLFDNDYGNSGYGLQTYGGGYKIGVINIAGRYPQCTLYRVSRAFGIGGYGAGGYGGGDAVTIPAEISITGRAGIGIKTLPEFAGYSIIRRTGANEYAIYSTDGEASENLILVIF
jgi:hypothetical protein